MLEVLAALRAPDTPVVQQVGSVVADLDAAVAEHSRLYGCDPADWRFDTFGPGAVEELTVRGEPAQYTARLAFYGSAPEVELIQPLDGLNVYTPLGLHHLAVIVGSLAEAVEAMERAGFETVQAGWGFAPAGRGGFAYFDTTAALGYLLEAVELPLTSASSEPHHDQASVKT